MPDNLVYCFGDYELDPARHELRVAGAAGAIKLEGRPWDLLCHLVAHHGTFQSKAELLQRVWVDVVDEENVKQTIRTLRKVCGWRPGWPISAIRGGYRFDAEVTTRSRAQSGHVELAPACRPLYGSPRERSQNFVGRDALLAELTGELVDSERARVSTWTALEGLAGVGKTELALQLVWELQAAGHFRGGIFWLDSEAPDLTAQWGVRIADQCGIAEGAPRERCAELFRRLAQAGEPVLVVLDNVLDWCESKPHPLPAFASISLLVTSRERRLGGNAFRHRHVPVLSAPHDRDLLCGTAGFAVDAPEPLVAHLGGHALSLELAGAYLSAGDTSAEEYLRVLRHDGHAGLAGVEGAERTEGTEGADQQTVDRAFEATWERLDGPERAAWQLAACFAPEPVSFALSEAAGLTKAALRKLGRWHLVAVQDGRWSMHRLIRAFGQRAGGPESRVEARGRFVDGCITHAAAIKAIEFVDGYRIYAPDRPHLDRALEQACAPLAADPARLCALRNAIAKARHSLGEYDGARGLLEQALDCARRSLGEDHAGVAQTRSNLAFVLKYQGQLPQAEALLALAIGSGIRRGGELDPAVARSRFILAWVLQEQGRSRRARELLEQALHSDLTNFGPEDLHVAADRVLLSLVLHALGELEEARAMVEAGLRSALVHVDENHPRIAISRVVLARVLQAQGQLQRAQHVLECVVDTLTRNFGEDHPALAVSRLELAQLLLERGELPRAHTLAEQALRSNVSNFGEDHPDVTSCRTTLAVVRQRLGPRSRSSRRDDLRESTAP